MCIKNKSMLRVKGTFYGSNMQMLEVRLFPCIDPSKTNNINSTMCATMEE